jgi:putative ABC transport system permease protein
MPTLFQNLQYAWRQLRRSAEFTILAVVTLALGIGANTAMFTIVESVLLRPLPYTTPDRIVQINAAGGDSSDAVSWLDYRDICEQAHTLAEVAGYSIDVGVVQSKDTSISVVTSEVTPNAFTILGVQPLKGRTFTANEGQANGPQAVLISEGLWRMLGADPGVVGTTLRVNGRGRIVVGVMPSSFRFPESAGQDIGKGLWLPMQPTSEMLRDRGFDFFTVLARSAPGANLQGIQVELNLVAQRISHNDSRVDRKRGFLVISYHDSVTGFVHQVFLALVAALGLVLLIVCANVANLMIARCIGRQHEFVIRAALGAGQRRLVGQMVMEAGLLSVLGCALGLLVACSITAAVHHLPHGTIPRAEAIQVRWTVLLFLGAIAMVTTVLSALLPALFIARTDAQGVLRTGSRCLGTKSARSRVGGWLVAGEVGLSALLLVAAGLLFRTLWGLEHARLGFDATGVTSFTAMPADASGFGNAALSTPGNEPVSVATSVYLPLLESLRHTPGFEEVALATAPPFSGFNLQTNFRVLRRPGDDQRGLAAGITALSGRFEELMGTPVVRGRSISEQDTTNAPFVAVINETLARKYFAGEDALGQQLDLGGAGTGMLKPYTLVGIIGDQIDTSTAQPPGPLLMLPYQQIPPLSLFYPALLKTTVYFVVKTRGRIDVLPIARAVFHDMEPNLALDHFQSMQDAVVRSNFSSRLGLYLIAAFAGLALLMVIGGLYGVLSQIVSQRRQEFGLRVALGATRRSIVRLVLLRGSAIVALGLGAGVVLTFWMGRLIKSFLYGVKPFDITTYAFVVFALLIVGMGAASLPAWRAASFEPLRSLREE